MSEGSTLELRARARWLSCEEVCIPGSANLELSLPVARARKPANAPLFNEWRRKLPADMGTVGGAVQASVEGTIGEETGDFALSLAFKEPPESVEWFPHNVRGLRLGEVSIRTEGDRTNITFQATVRKGQELSAAELSSVVVYVDPRGQRRAVQVPIPLRGD
jgi:DsbC/DsbD-like thiol-disulfide interchange protein